MNTTTTNVSRLSLDNGTWEFFYSPKPFNPLLNSLPDRTLFTGKMVTPGYWDDHYELYDEEDFFGLTARFNPDYRKPHFPMGRSLTPHAASSFLIGTGYYRKLVTVPCTPENTVTLTIGPAMWGCSLFVNGTYAGHITGYSTASRYEISRLLKPGAPNEIIIVVCNVHDDGGAYHRVDETHDGQAVGARPGQHRGLAAQGYQSERAGIGGGVSLKITGSSRITDWFVSSEDATPHWHVSLQNGNGTTLRWQFGNLAAGTVACTGDTVDFTTPVPTAQLWSDRTPTLYTLTLQLLHDNTVQDEDTLKWAPRTIATRDKTILVNGSPTFFRGATEHCYFAETCNPHFDTDKYLHDLGVLRQAGFNFIRCHTWCPPEPFYDACDQLGIFVQTELPSVYSFPEAEAIIRLIRRHPCAVILCEGNEKIIDEKAIERLKHVVELLHTLAPGMLFNPQEATRGVEYGFAPGQVLDPNPFPHDAARFKTIEQFSDVYGSLGNGFFSYSHDCFPGIQEVERLHTLYHHPCLSHEIGILGGYLDFSLESRYENTFIGTDMFRAARENMQKHGVYQYARQYYEANCPFISALRKQLMENLRSCSCFAGYDFLGGIDTHWHLIGYPCGVFNEFYEEKFGETIADVKRYNNESVLLCGYGNRRNLTAGSLFETPISLSYYGAAPLTGGTLAWTFTHSDGTVAASGEIPFGPVAQGTIAVLATLRFTLPDDSDAARYTLDVTATADGNSWENRWPIWTFPKPHTAPAGAIVADALTPQLIQQMADGAAVLLTANFPCETSAENFRTCTSGRSLGHAGTIMHPHPLWQHFPHDGHCDWQFFPLMRNSHAIVQDADMPPYSPILELIPSFKLIRRKSPLAEYAIGKGRLIICGLRLDADDPAARWLQSVLLDYLATPAGWWTDAPAWSPENLLARLPQQARTSDQGALIDAGGRPVTA